MPAVPETTRKALSLCVVDFVQPVGAAVCIKSMAVPTGNTPVVTPVPPLATGNVPVTPVVSGSPVRLVATPDVGVPNIGVTRVGLVALTKTPEPVPVYSAAVEW